jgi:ubiquinone/menaquinone biosynthesis C-methylase UbiE
MCEDIVARARIGFARAAAAYAHWAELGDQRTDAALYIEAADLRPGDRVLEIGAGSGEVTVPLARHVGPNGQVFATDLSPEMLSVARDRVAAQGLDNVSFRTVDANRLELAGSRFDAVVSAFTWTFLPDPAAAAARVAGVLAPSRRFTVSVWGPPERVEMVWVARSAIHQVLRLDRAEDGQSAAPVLGTGTAVGEMLRSAGFDEVRVRPFSLALTWPSPDHYMRWFRDTVPSMADLVIEHAPEREEQVWSNVSEAARKSAAPDGTVTLNNPALLGTGRRPL